MLKIMLIPAAVAIATLPVVTLAQTTTPSPNLENGKVMPTAPNSGAGIPGQPGNKNGPPAKSGTTGAANSATTPLSKEDAAKVPGKPGGKSGPPVMPPSGSTAK